MFSAIVGLIEKLQELKLKKQKKDTKKEVKKAEKKLKEEGSSVVNVKDKAKKTKKVKDSKEKEKKLQIKVWILKVLKWILEIIEQFIMWLISIIGIYGFFIILVVLVLMVVIYGLLHIDFDLSDGSIFRTDRDAECVEFTQVIEDVNFDLSIIDQNGAAYTDQQKNMYRCFKVYTDIYSGKYGNTTELFTENYKKLVDKTDIITKTAATMGFMSIENGYSFPGSDNILVTPTTTQPDGYNDAWLGLEAEHKDFDGKYEGKTYYTDTFVNNFKKDYSYPNAASLPSCYNYGPYGMAIQIGFLSGKYEEMKTTQEYVDTYGEEVMNKLGINANKEKLNSLMHYFMLANGYHGYSTKMNKPEINFWCGLWAASSDVDNQRGFDKIILNNPSSPYAESGYRGEILGYSSYSGTYVGKSTKITNLSYMADGQTKGYITVNGTQLSVPLVRYVIDYLKNNNCADLASEIEADLNGRYMAPRLETAVLNQNYSYGFIAYATSLKVLSDLGVSAPLSSGSNSDECVPSGSGETIGLNHTIDFTNGEGSLKALLAASLKPCGECLYSWGGGRDSYAKSAKDGLSPKWKEFYNEWVGKEKAGQKYNWKSYRAANGGTTSASIANGLDCSGLVGWAVTQAKEPIGSSKNWILHSSSFGGTYAGNGWGKASVSINGLTNYYRPGDIGYNNGHVWMCIGPSEHGGIVIIHSSPDGVQLNGFGGGEKTAKEYMEKYWPDFAQYFSKSNFTANYQSGYQIFRWNILPHGDTSGKGLTDKEGFYDMTAEQILEYLFNPKNSAESIIVGEYKNTPGKPQGVFNIGGTQKTTSDLLDEMNVGQNWGAVTSLSSTGKARIESLVQYMGDAVHAPGGTATCSSKDTAQKVLTDTKLKGPFYHQGTSGDEKWGNIVSGSNLDNPDNSSTFNRNGCHTYALAYALSVTQGRLINPPEALVLGWYGGLWNSGMGGDANVNNFKNNLGLNIKTVSDDVIQGKAEVDAVLDANGVVIVYLTGEFAHTQHWVCITEKVNDNGTDKYKIWTSTNINQIFQLYDFQHLYNNKSGDNWLRMAVLP